MKTKLAISAVAATGAIFAAVGAATAATPQSMTAVRAAASGNTTPSLNCYNAWNDANTFGISCSSSTPNVKFRAVAWCTNGKKVYGATVGNRGRSYAYCTSVNSTYRPGSGYGTLVA